MHVRFGMRQVDSVLPADGGVLYAQEQNIGGGGQEAQRPGGGR
jgi:hypothetical protein